MTKPLREQHLDNDPKNITILQLYESILDTARMIAENKAEEHGLDGSESKIPEPVKLARVNVQWAEALCQAI